MIKRLFDRLLGPRILLADRIHYSDPRELGLEAEEVEIPRMNGSPLSGLWLKGKEGAPGVLFCPGNSGNLLGHLPYLEVLSRTGFSILGIDYSGYGQSGGKPRLANLIGDAEAGLEELARRCEAGGLPGIFGIFGISLGANIALEVAARRKEVGAVAVEGLSIQREVVRGALAEGALGPLWIQAVQEGTEPPPPRVRHRLPWSFLASLLARPFSALADWCFPFPGKDPRRGARRMGDRPTFVIHGTDDRLLPLEAALLTRRALSGPGRLWLIPGVGHPQEPALVCFDEYASQLGAFFRESLLGEGLRNPQLSWRSEPRGSGFQVELELGPPAGPYLIMAVSEKELYLFKIWVDEGDRKAELGFHVRSPLKEVHALAYHHAARRGETWEAPSSERLRCYRRVGGKFRGLTAALNEGRLEAADDLLEELDREELQPAFNHILKLHHARRLRLGGHSSSLVPAVLIVILCALGGGCSAPSPFPDLGKLSDQQTLKVLSERASRVQSLYAVVRISMDSPEMSGAFDVACYFEAPGRLRMSAFKDFLLGTRPIFDLAFRDGEYSVAIHEEEETKFRHGKLESFVTDLPRMGSLYWLQEGLFLPGSSNARWSPHMKRRTLGLIQSEGPGGSKIKWSFVRETLEITNAELWPPGRSTPMTIRYRDYRISDGVFVPGKVIVIDPENDLEMRCILRDLEVNPELEPDVFVLEEFP